jgi:hypothetical protein
MKALATALLALALLPATALAKSGLMLDSTPDGLTAGQSWDARFSYVHNDAVVEPLPGKVPAVRITNTDTGASRTFVARRQHNGMWAARVLFSQPGEWRYTVEGFPPSRDQQAFPPVEIAPKPPAREEPHDPPVVAASTGGGSSFPWGWTIVGGVLAIAGGVLVVRRLRT